MAIGAAVLAVTVAGTAVAEGPIQPDGSEAAPPFVEPEVIAQPDGSEAAPPFVEPEVIAQPPNRNKQLTGSPTQVSGPVEPASAADGQGGSSETRSDTGGVDGADTPGGRSD